MDYNITSVTFNWFSGNNGDEFTRRIVGNKYGLVTVVKITEHLPMGDGDRLYYDIHYSDGGFNRVFNPNEVSFDKIN